MEEGFAVEWPGVAEDDIAVDGDGWENWERAGKSCGTLKVTAH